MGSEEKSSCRVCVTGGAGFIGSSLVKKLLDRGYTVHATLRNLEDESKTGLLKRFPGAETRLKLFRADIYKPEEFKEAIQDCDFVLHVATPLIHTPGYEYKDRVEATVAGVRAIAEACIKSGTVKRLIYTASVVGASPLKDDGNGYKDAMDEACWTPLDISYAHSEDYLTDYTASKTLAEKEILSFSKDGVLEVVTLACGLVGGTMPHLPYTPATVAICFSQITEDEAGYNALRFLEDLLGKLPLVHIEDVCEAHIFSMETPSMDGRFLCANSFVSTSEMATYFQQNYPEFQLSDKFLGCEEKREIKWSFTKLVEKGFSYQFSMEKMLDDCIACARRIGDLK